MQRDAWDGSSRGRRRPKTVSPEDRALFFIAERLHVSVVAVERMSRRQVLGWLMWFDEQNKPADDALDVKALSKQQLRSMFKK
jgi:hypothetical protein